MKKIKTKNNDILKHFFEEDIAVGTERVSSKDAWFAIALAFIISLGVITNAAGNVSFVLDCEGCGGAWTHAAINGQLQEKVLNFSEELPATVYALTDVVNIYGGLTTFFLGFLSSILILGLFGQDQLKTKRRRTKSKKSAGFISTGLLYIPVLTLALIGASFYPVSASGPFSPVSLPIEVPRIGATLEYVDSGASIEVSNPAINEIWRTGEDRTISWSVSGFGAKNLKIYFYNISEDETVLVKEYSSKTAPQARSFDLRVPSNLTSGNYIVIVCDAVKNICSQGSPFFIEGGVGA